jgi:hypothetical protein
MVLCTVYYCNRPLVHFRFDSKIIRFSRFCRCYVPWLHANNLAPVTCISFFQNLIELVNSNSCPPLLVIHATYYLGIKWNWFSNCLLMNVMPFKSDSLSRVLCILYLQHYVIKFVSDLRQVCGFLRVLRFLPPIKTDCYDVTDILWKRRWTP